jgi:uncharacterized protein YndB with AHSA1/START domain
MSTPPLLGTVDHATGAVRLERTLPAAVHEVWDALTDPARLHEWLAPVEQGSPADGAFVLRMSADETATCAVATWDPPNELRVTWDYTGEEPSELSVRLSAVDGATLLTLEHTQITADPVQYGAGWHVHLDRLAARLFGVEGTAWGCEGEDFMAAYRALRPRYAATANGLDALLRHTPSRMR